MSIGIFNTVVKQYLNFEFNILNSVLMDFKKNYFLSPTSLRTCVRTGGDDDKEDEAVPGVREFMHWCKLDHSRPAVSVKQSPFFPDLILTVSDWAFHIWEVGLDQVRRTNI